MQSLLSATLGKIVDVISTLIITVGIVNAPVGSDVPPLHHSTTTPQFISIASTSGPTRTIQVSASTASPIIEKNTLPNKKITVTSSRVVTTDAAGCPAGTLDFLKEAKVNINDTIQCRSLGETSFLYNGTKAKIFSVRYGHSGGTSEGSDVVYPVSVKILWLPPDGKLVQADMYLSLPDQITYAAIDHMVGDVAATTTKAHTSYPLEYMEERGVVSGPDSQGRFCGTFDGKIIVHGTIVACAKPGREVEVTGRMRLNDDIYPFTYALEMAHTLVDPSYIEQAKSHPYPFSSDLLTWAYRSDNGGYWVFEFLEWQDSVTYPHKEKRWNWINDQVLVRVNSDGQGCIVKAGHVDTLNLYDTTGDLLRDTFDCSHNNVKECGQLKLSDSPNFTVTCPVNDLTKLTN